MSLISNSEYSQELWINLIKKIKNPFSRSAVYTEFFTLIDVDLMPNSGLRKHFINFISKSNKWDDHEDKEVYIIPAFEMAANQEMPKTKGCK